MSFVTLSELVEPVQTCQPAAAFSGCFPYIDIAAIDRDAKSIANPQSLSVEDPPSRARQLVRRGDVLVSTVRPNLNAVALVDSHAKAIASTGFTVLRPRTQVLDSSYLFRWVQTPAFINEMVRQATGASYPAVSDAIVKGSKIPLPPLAEQKRIAAILDKAEAIRRKREQAIKLADEFLRSLFLDMFGDPVSNPKGWPQKPLRDCVEMANGSTPPKEVAKYWNGSVPWVSPKDMKFREITGSIDHVSELAVSDQTVRLVPSGTVLIVIRGMILAHTVPIAITSVECTINQDMKALRPNAELDAVFLEAALRTMHNSLLAKVSTSTHGTKKLDSERLRQIFLPIPPRVSQEKFRDMTRIMNKTHSLAHGCREAASSLRDSLVNAAFRYEL